MYIYTVYCICTYHLVCWPNTLCLHWSDFDCLFLTNNHGKRLLLHSLLLSASVCTSDKERIKVSLYGGLKLEGEVLVSQNKDLRGELILCSPYDCCVP